MQSIGTVLDGRSIFDYLDCEEYVISVENTSGMNGLFERFHRSGSGLLSDCIEKKLSLLRILDIFLVSSGARFSKTPVHSALEPIGIKEYIDRHAVEGTLTLDQLAARMHTHPAHFIRIFKKHFGVSPMKYVNDVRIAAAKDYLKNTDAPIKTIAQTMGYDNTIRFSNFFKRYTGMSPREYREMNDK